ncbi:unnamed protein product [Vitrella brassicaformis CCMP3155]|uniref:Reverse transcriptase domain-containing protein n=1 Tax=Vitrella brassicaformis (strain CCMP3155) TaxID=1169540 RepID=A0A0G4E9L4_VITBC|nr:unnamed protein product [Vitrella brassicaformis CCMP3155]|eukprot:CEL92307.1 unnamed protein product [Vitrella brassicaformis CCMP3155]
MVLDTTEKYVKDEEDSDVGCLIAIFVPTMLLFPMNRGGKGGHRKWGTRFKRFWAGEWQGLLDESRNFAEQGRHVFAPRGDGPVDGVSEPSLEEIKLRAAERFVRQGELSRAARRLTAAKVAPATAATLQQVKDLHPAAPLPRKPQTQNSPDEPAVPLTVPPRVLLAALKTAPRGSAAGPTGWRYEHLRACMGEGDASAEDGTVPLPSFVYRMLAGNMPDSCTTTLSAARLFALMKDNGGVRPIAVGDVLRRWVTKAVCMENKLAFEDDFAPLQFAVGTSAGGEKIFRACQTYLETRRDDSDRRVLVTLDCKNAFNSIDRQAILDELGTKWPSFVDSFWQFYGTPAELWYRMEDGRTETILSQEGDAKRTLRIVILSMWDASSWLFRGTSIRPPGAQRRGHTDGWIDG